MEKQKVSNTYFLFSAFAAVLSLFLVQLSNIITVHFKIALCSNVMSTYTYLLTYMFPVNANFI